MDKKEFLNLFKYEDKSAIANLYDKLILSEKINSDIFSTEFYPPSIWNTLINMGSNFDVNIVPYGIFKDSERRIIAFSHYEINDYPVELLCIENKSKFSTLKHKDFLGAIMSLGVKREKFGDLIVKDQRCYAAVHREILDYIKDNLNSIGNSPCSITVLDDKFNFNIEPDFQEITIFSSSLRCDGIICGICKITRSNSENLIKKGKVLINYESVVEKNTIIKSGDIITVRGFGKFKMEQTIGWTGSGKNKIIVKKFV